MGLLRQYVSRNMFSLTGTFIFSGDDTRRKFGLFGRSRPAKPSVGEPKAALACAKVSLFPYANRPISPLLPPALFLLPNNRQERMISVVSSWSNDGCLRGKYRLKRSRVYYFADVLRLKRGSKGEGGGGGESHDTQSIFESLGSLYL